MKDQGNAQRRADAAPVQVGSASDKVVIPRWMQLIGLPLLLIAGWVLITTSGRVVLLFLVAGIIALILNPIVHRMTLWKVPRGLAIAVVYLGFLGGLTVTVALLIEPAGNQIEGVQATVPDLIRSAEGNLDDFQSWLNRRGIDVQIKRPGEDALASLERSLIARSGDIASFTGDLLKRLVEAIFALVLILVISIYMLLYGRQIGALVRRVVPTRSGIEESDFPQRVQRGVFNYVRAQILFSGIMGLSAGVSLWVFGLLGIFPEGKTYALFFGAWFFFMEFIPYIGPFLGAAPPILVALFSNPLTVIWLALLFIALQQIEGHIVAPMLFGTALRINPLLVIFALLFGANLYGITGALLALPIAAMIREAFIYLQEHMTLEPWTVPLAAVGGSSTEVDVSSTEVDVSSTEVDVSSTEAGGPVAARKHPDGESGKRSCPSCSAPVDALDTKCPVCGVELPANNLSR